MPFSKYPKPVKSRSGCKVSWLYYETKEEAEKAKLVAQSEARRLSGNGYDFGFQIPGGVIHLKSSKAGGEYHEYDGLYEVCIP